MFRSDFVFRHERHLKRNTISPKLHDNMYEQSLLVANTSISFQVQFVKMKQSDGFWNRTIASYYKNIRKPQLHRLAAHRPFSSVSAVQRVLQVDTLVFVSGVWLGLGVGVWGGVGGWVAIRTPSCGVYRSSLSTRPPGCSGLESGKKAAFTSRPRSVSAA